MRCAKSILGLAVVGLVNSAAAAQSATTLLSEGDTIIGIGALDSTTYVGVTDSKLWSSLADTSLSDTSRDGALLRNGFVMLREGTSIFSPPSSRLDEWISINMNANGDLAQSLRLTVGTGALDGVFWNLVPIAIEGDAVDSPFVGDGTILDNFAVVKINKSNTVFVLGEVANPDITGPREDALIRYQVDSQGNVVSYDVLATKGMLIDALTTIVDTLGSAEHILAVNDNGDYITFVSALGARALMINLETVVAQEGLPSSTGKNWAALSLSKVHINNRGDYVVTGAQVNQVYLIEKNGLKFAEAGDILPSLSAAPVGTGTQAPVYLTESGDVFWSARFSGVNDDAYARNYEPFIQRDRTVIGGSLVTQIGSDENAFAISPNGRFFVGRVQLQPNRKVLAFVDFGLILEIPGCVGNPGKLTLDSGRALVGGQFSLAMDEGQVPGALPVLSFSTSPAIPGSECGLPSRYGEVLVSPLGLSAPVILPPWNGTDPRVITFNIPNAIGLVDAVFYAQGVFIDPAQPSPEKYRLTNGLRIEFGPP